MNTQSVSSIFFVLLVVLVLLTIFGIMYLYITSKSKERLALIERGMDPNLAKSDFWVQVGIIGGGAALGLIAGDVMPGKYGPLVAILFAAVGLVVYNVITRNKAKRIR
jgi:predicted membrane channel-forming protein YqfA (hemolysin III family)